MNQEKIGKFIADARKKKNMTQLELAEKLGVTDKTIGNWENARCMPDVSLFKPLCEVLDITVNDLINGEKIQQEDYPEVVEKNLFNTLDYTKKRIDKKNRTIGIILFLFGILITFMAITIFSSWSSFYYIFGGVISFIGLFKILENFKIRKRIIIGLGYFVLYLSILFTVDYIGVIFFYQIPKLSYILETNNMIVYKSLFYNVFQVNYNTDNEYFIVDTKKEYDTDTVPNVPFNRSKSSIENIIKYKNAFIENEENLSNLIKNLPLSEYYYVYLIDLEHLALTIDYNVADWYIKENGYLAQSIIYNSVSIFALIENASSITFNFSGKSYVVTKEMIQDLYPHFEDIVRSTAIKNEIDKNNFNLYLEDKIKDDEFIEDIFLKLFKNGI